MSSNDVPTPAPTRRTVVSLAVGIAGACAAGSAFATSATAAPGEQGGPAGSKTPKGTLPTTPIDIGPITDYAKDGVYDKLVKSQHVLIHKSADRLAVMSAICPHKRCLVALDADQLKCPCHSSFFNLDGGRVEGPAKSSLPHLAVSTNKAGHIIADPKKLFEEKQWDDAASYIAIPTSAAPPPPADGPKR